MNQSSRRKSYNSMHRIVSKHAKRDYGKKNCKNLSIPLYYQGIPIKIITNFRALKHAVQELISYNPHFVGFDIEWRPNFIKGQRPNRVSIIQIAHQRIIILVQLIYFGEVRQQMLDSGLIGHILANVNIVKCGVGIYDDVKKLYKDWDIKMEKCVDLNELNLYPPHPHNNKHRSHSISLAKLCEKVLGYSMKYKTKKMSCSNWAAPDLSSNQCLYAAEDAMTGYLIFERLLQINPNIYVTPQNVENLCNRRIVDPGFESHRDKMMKIAMDKRFQSFPIQNLLYIYKQVNVRSIKQKYHSQIEDLVKYFDDIFAYNPTTRQVMCIIASKKPAILKEVPILQNKNQSTAVIPIQAFNSLIL